ncbi:MAG TPA: SDR family NAD(P)-dependent oxidoreductase [Mycobacteriales bacterium]|nr:SDR family NAD(P)-dependent oxidoreductase [Mycobacteriales bacterium]
MDSGRPVAVVTGASSGIGKAIAGRLATSGFEVFAGVRKQQDADAIADTGQLRPLLVDVTDSGSIAAAAAEVRTAAGDRGLAALVNNAGVGMTGPIEALPVDTFRRQYEVNVFGQIAVTQAFLPLIRVAAGRIVNTGSVGDRLSLPFGAPLASSKWAIAAITESLRLELRPWGIYVILLEPASIHTEVVAKVEQNTASVIDRFDDLQRARYAGTYQAMMRNLARNERAGSGPEVVAETVHRALTVRRPRTRYLVGKDARKLAFMARLPDRVFDQIRVRMFGLPAQFGGMRAADARLRAGRDG